MEVDGIALYLFLDESASAKLYCDNNTIKNNTIVNTYKGGSGQAGIYIDSFTNTTILNNNMINCGLFLEKDELNAYLSNRITNNKVNNKPLIYKTNEEYLESTDFSNAGQIILINSNHSVISNLDLSNATVGISLYYCKNLTIYNNTASKGFVGFLLYNSNENNISTNIANDNSWCGILLDSSSSNNITNNDFRRNPSCIVEIDCSGNKKTNNKCDPTDGVPIPGDDDDDDDEPPIITGYNNQNDKKNYEWYKRNENMKIFLETYKKNSKSQNNKKSKDDFCVLKIWSERWDGRTDSWAGRDGKNWDEYKIKWIEKGWYVKYLVINGECDKTGNHFLYKNFNQDFISYPSDLPDTMESLWSRIKNERLSKEQIQQKFNEISERINLCETDRARFNPHYKDP